MLLYSPGTGDLHDIGIGKGKNYAVNIPLKDGIDDDTYRSIFRPVSQLSQLKGALLTDETLLRARLTHVHIDHPKYHRLVSTWGNCAAMWSRLSG